MTEKHVRVRVVAITDNERVLTLGDGVVQVSEDDWRHCRSMASLLHYLAWDLEDKADQEESKPRIPQGVGDGHNTRTPRPRKVTLPTTDVFWEVSPDKFVEADSFTEACVRSEYPDTDTVSLDRLVYLYDNIQIEEV